MIEKLDIKDYENKEQLVWFGVINKLNQLCDAVNGILDYAPLEMAMKAEKQNIDIGELAYLQKENGDLKDELQRTRKALERARHSLKEIRSLFLLEKDNPARQNKWVDTAIRMWGWAEDALDEITELEQKD